jgi:HSP20 family protein
MSILRKIEPRKRESVEKRMTPLTHSLEEVFEDFYPRRWMETFEPFGWRWPMGVDFEKSFRLDVIDRDKALIVRGELPGVEKDDIEVTVMGDRLMIEAEREFEEKDEKESYYRHEVGYGKLMRTIPLPVEVDSEHVTAEMKDGILEISLPKAHTVERHTIKVA